MVDYRDTHHRDTEDTKVGTENELIRTTTFLIRVHLRKSAAEVGPSPINNCLIVVEIRLKQTQS